MPFPNVLRLEESGTEESYWHPREAAFRFQGKPVHLELVRWSPASTLRPAVLQEEIEPGMILERFAREPHPFSLVPVVNPVRAHVAAYLAHLDELILSECALALKFCRERALALRADSIRVLRGVSYGHLRALHLRLCGDDPSPSPPLGTFCHVALWREMCQMSSCPDSLFLSSMVEGFPLMGDIEMSHCWPPMDPAFLRFSRETSCMTGPRVFVKRSARSWSSVVVGCTPSKCGRQAWRTWQRISPVVQSLIPLKLMPFWDSGCPCHGLASNKWEKSDPSTMGRRQALLETVGVRCWRSCRCRAWTRKFQSSVRCTPSVRSAHLVDGWMTRRRRSGKCLFFFRLIVILLWLVCSPQRRVLLVASSCSLIPLDSRPASYTH